MAPELKILLASAEGQKRELLTRLEALPEDARGQAKPGQWSPLQTITHLVQFEEDMLRWIEAANPAKRPGIKAVLASMLISATMRNAIPVPAPPGAEPKEPDTLPNLQQRWQAVRTKLAERLATVTAGDDAAFAQHPLFGPVTAVQLMTMLDAHLTYHLRRPPLSVTR